MGAVFGEPFSLAQVLYRAITQTEAGAVSWGWVYQPMMTEAVLIRILRH